MLVLLKVLRSPLTHRVALALVLVVVTVLQKEKSRRPTTQAPSLLTSGRKLSTQKKNSGDRPTAHEAPRTR